MTAPAESPLSSETAARARLEELLWPNGPLCPHCGGGDRIYNLGDLRRRLKKCGRCRKQFTIRTGTILESSHVPLVKWLQATVLAAQNPRCTAGRLARALAIGPAAAELMVRRLRHALRMAEINNVAVSTLDPEKIVATIIRARATRGRRAWPRQR